MPGVTWASTIVNVRGKLMAHPSRNKGGKTRGHNVDSICHEHARSERRKRNKISRISRRKNRK